METLEFEGKTYEEAVKKASQELNVDERDLDIEVKEVDTKGILGLLGTKKIRIMVKLRAKEEGNGEGSTITPTSAETPSGETPLRETAEEFGIAFLKDFGKHVGLDFQVMATDISEKTDRILFLVQCDDGDVLIGKDGEILEALQHLLRLAVAKRFKHNLKLLIDINGYRERRKKALTIMAKRLADKAKRSGKKFKTDPLNPYERRIIHTLFKHNKGITTKSEGEGHIKRVVLTPTGIPFGGDRGGARGGPRGGARGGFRGNARGRR
ncbi:MAG TPA: RNA-binding cell elongation regulator Jag/EloR [Syntrophorhabdaceae bacterium]|nr:RNA-binding cell elongation regulator Jag/EloR [Syntrophorhabdaceae bacterium]